MPGFPAARILADMHTCPVCMGAPMPILGPGMPNVIVGFFPAARATDLCTCLVPAIPPVDPILMGSPTVLIGFLPAAHMGAPTTLGGVILPPCLPTVMIGYGGMPPIVLPGGMIIQDVVLPDGTVVTRVGDNITVTGSPEFRSRVTADIVKLHGTPTGRGLLESLNSSGNKLTIQQGNPPVTSYDSPGDRFRKADGTPGAGTNATITITGNSETLEDGSEPWMTVDSPVVLGHEMVHAEQAQRGTITPGVTNGVNNRETEAVGLPPYQNNPYTENKIRRDLGVPARERY